MKTKDISDFEYKIKSKLSIDSSKSNNSTVNAVCGFYAKDDRSKMVFKLKKIGKEEAKITY